MSTRSWRFLILFLLILGVSLIPVSAQEIEEPANPGGIPGFERAGRSAEQSPSLPSITPVDPALIPDVNHPTREGEASTFSTMRVAPRPITVLVLLESAPALASLPSGADLSGSGAATVEAAAGRVRAEQRSVVTGLQQLGISEIASEMTYSANAVIVNVDASQISEIEALPGVLAVVPDQIGYLDNANSVPFINAVSAWQSAGGYTGSGIRIGIIDSGIDYTHANFGGSGDTTHYTGQNNTDISDFGYDGSKVVSGYDFVGSAWTGGVLVGAGGSPLGSVRVFPFGDNDPLDCNGHGSHVAGTSAGYGVDENGLTFAGPWDSSIDFASMTIGPGVAPEASLYALKIGGCGNAVSFAAAALALEFAIDPNGDGNLSDHLDVINNSYGGAYGTALEILATQFDLAAQAGIIVVASAGNETDTYFVNGAPGISEWAISTASSVPNTTFNGLEITTGTPGAFPSYPFTVAASLSQSGALGVFGPMGLRLVGGTGNAQGCALGDYAGFAGEAGLIVWSAAPSGCASGVRMTNAVNAGNVGGLVVVTANPADFPFIALACAFNGGPSGIPCVSISGTDGAILQANPGAFTVRFDDSLRSALGVNIGDTLSSFSSRGPRTLTGTGEVVLKPDITAPGNTIVSTGVGSGNGPTTLSGTSMASPHITGVAALLRQVHPTWSVTEIKALMMNTALHDLWTQPDQTGNNYGVSRIGAGRVDVAHALNTEVLAYDADHPERVSASFGLVEVIDTASITQSITVENKGGTPETYNVSFQQLNDTPGVSFSVSPAQITVGAGGTATVQVTLTAIESSMANVNTPDPTTPLTQNGAFGNLPRHRIMEEGGYVVLDSTSTVADLRIPVHAAARPASDMAADGDLMIGQSDTGFAALRLAGDGVQTGTNYPLDVISQVTAFELVAEDPQALDPALDGADIQYIGVTSDYTAVLELCAGDTTCAINNTMVYFGVVTYGSWSTASGFNSWFDIGVDSDEDDFYDTTVFNFETGLLANLDFTDTIISFFTDGNSFLTSNGNPLGGNFINEWSAAALETYVFNNNVLVFPVAATDLGLSAANTDFQFDVAAFADFFFGDWLPETAPFWYSYDIATPVYAFSDVTGVAGGPYPGVTMWNDTDGNFIPVDYNVTGLVDPLPPILLLHHHNAADASVGRAEVVQVQRSSEMDAAVSKTVDDETPAEGQSVTFTVTVSNLGPGILQDPVVVDTLPLGLTYVSNTCSGTPTVTPVANGTEVECDLTGSIVPSGFALSFDIVATVDAGTTGTTVTNVVALTDYNTATVDLNLGNNQSGVNVCVDGVDGQCNPPPAIADIRDGAGTSIMGGTAPADLSVIDIIFSTSVRGGTDENGADNPDNYRLLAEGSVAGFQTNVCSIPVGADDTQVPYTVSYDNATFTSTLAITNAPLPIGNYRLMICGSTSIVNPQGVPLDGNGDNQPGDDALINFSVTSSGGTGGTGDSSAGGTGGAGSSGVLTAEELAGMQLPATGETPWWNPSPITLLALVVGGAGLGWFVYRRRKAQQ